MQRFFQFLLALSCVVYASTALGDDVIKTLTIEHPLARATPPGARTGAAFLTITNKGKETDRLIRAASPVAGSVEIHEMRMDNTIMRMRAVASVEIKPGQTVAFKQGSLHLMLLGLKQALSAGDRFPLLLTFDKAGTVQVSVAVEELVGPDGSMGKR